MQKYVGQWTFRDLKQTGIRDLKNELSGRNMNLENVDKVLRICASNRREADGGESVVDLLIGRKPG